MLEPIVQEFADLVGSFRAIPEVAPYAETIVQVALDIRPDGFRTFAWIIAGVGHEETRWGRARGLNGTTGPTIIGADGHGRGLMQIDDRAHPDLCSTLDANGIPTIYDPSTNIRAGATILDAGLRTFAGNLPAGLASYNAGPHAVRRALSDQRNPDSVTTRYDHATGQGYSWRVLDVLRRWGHAP